MKVLHVFTLASTGEAFFDGQFRYLADNGHELLMVSSTAPCAEFCQRNRVRFIPVNIARRVDLKSDMRAIRQLRKIIKTEHIDIVVGHTPKGALVSMTAARLTGVKHRIYYRHGLIYTTAKGLKRRIFKTVEQFTAMMSTKIVNVSHSLSAIAIQDHLNGAKKQVVIGAGTCGGIDTQTLFNPRLISQSDISQKRDELGIATTDMVLGFCGRLCKDKGIVELIEGFQLFRRTHLHTQVKLLLIGKYDERDILPEHIKAEIRDNDHIIYLGKQPHESLPLLYSLMDIFIFPSYREGFGMCVLEASAMRVPILVSRSHGCIDSIRENETGYYIDLTAEGIALGIENLIIPKQRTILGAGGREFAVQNFERTTLWPQIKEFYNFLSNHKR